MNPKPMGAPPLFHCRGAKQQRRNFSPEPQMHGSFLSIPRALHISRRSFRLLARQYRVLVSERKVLPQTAGTRVTWALSVINLSKRSCALWRTATGTARDRPAFTEILNSRPLSVAKTSPVSRRKASPSGDARKLMIPLIIDMSLPTSTPRSELYAPDET